MEQEKSRITVSALVQLPVAKTWQLWTLPAHITQWNNASDDWHTPHATADVKPGGKFLSRMEAKDGSAGFDFEGIFTRVEEAHLLEYTIADGRKVTVSFQQEGAHTRITEMFEPENIHSHSLQQQGWQAILDNFARYAETFSVLHTLHFSIDINASVDKVYATMLAEEGYKQWTRVFNSGSHFKGSWEKGSTIYFLGLGEEGKTAGMVSRIKENIPNRFVSIEHLGMIAGENIITSGEKVEGWAGATENYAFSEENGVTTVKVSLDSAKEWMDYMNKTYPAALQKLKEICEPF